MKSRIILAVSTDLTFDQRMQRIAKSLSSEHEVILVGRLKKQSGALEPDSEYRQIRLNCFFEKGLLFYFFLNVRLFFFLLFRKADVISATDLDTLPACTFASKIRNIRLAFDAHEWYTELPELAGRTFTTKIWRTIERIFIPYTDIRYTVNHSIAHLYKTKYGLDFLVLRNMPFSSEQVNVGLDHVNTSPKMILYQGVLNIGRGLEQMIQLMDRLEGFELHLAGEGDLSEYLRNLAKSNRFPGRICFHGYLTPAKLKLLTAEAWIGINLLENISLNYYYSLANKFFDYVQAEIPQITMEFPEYALLNNQHEVAVLISDLNPDSIENAIITLTSMDTYRIFRSNCQTAAAEWSWENEQDKLLQAYKAS